jgi:hypothetical protein
MEQLWDVLLKQAPVIVVMGVVIWWLQKRYLAKDMQLEKLSVDFIEISTKWHDWLQKGLQANSEDCKEIIKKLDEIKHIVENR